MSILVNHDRFYTRHDNRCFHDVERFVFDFPSRFATVGEGDDTIGGGFAEIAR